VNKQDSVYENSKWGAIRPFDNFESYQAYLNYVAGAHAWVTNKTGKKQQLKNEWLKKYLVDSIFRDHLLFELDDDESHDYGPISHEVQEIIKTYLNWMDLEF
jgi:hypothetical protein